MRIERLRIDGFGLFREVELPLAPGLTVFCGPNEAGKSTLLWFVRSVLFGFEKRRNAAERYDCPRGAHGGELLLAAPGGALWVRRTAGRKLEGDLSLRSAAGEALPPSRLAEALGGISRELYFELFAFGLHELSSFDALASQGSISEALSSAGIPGARRLPQATEALRRSSQELFGPRGAKRLNALLSELEQVRDRLRALGDRPAEYGSAQERLTAAEGELLVLEAQMEPAASELDLWRRLESVAPQLGELVPVEAERESLRPLASFPEAAVARLEGLLARREKALAERGRIESEEAEAQAGLDRVRVPSASARVSMDAQPALEAFFARAVAMRELPQRRAALQLRWEQVADALSGLNLLLGPQELLQAQWGEAARAELEGLQAAGQRSQEAVRDAQEALRAAQREQQRVSSDLLRFEAAQSALPAESLETLRRRQRALVQLSSLQAELSGIAQAQREGAQLPKVADGGNAWPEWVAVGISLLLAALAAAAARALPAAMRWAAWGTAAAALMAGWAIGRRASIARARRRAAAREELIRCSEQARALENRASATQAMLSAAALEAGVPAGIGAGDLAVATHVLAQKRARAEAREPVEQELADGRGREAMAGEAASRAREALVAAETALAVAGQGLEAWLCAQHFPSGLSAEGAMQRWLEARGLRQRIFELREEERRIEAEAGGCEEVASAVRALAERAGWGPMPAEQAAAALVHAAQAERGRRLEAERLEERQAALAAQRRRAEEELTDVDRLVKGLLGEAGCGSAEALRAQSARAARYCALTQRAAQLSARVEAGSGRSVVEAARLLREAGGAVEQRRIEREHAMQERMAKRAALAEGCGRLRQALEALESDREAAQLREKEEALRAQAEQVAARYAVEKLALALLDSARRRHEEQHQPRLLQAASELFEKLTEGRYRRVDASAEDSGLWVRDERGGHWSAEQLSRGTREQLYLAFRLAAIRDFARSGHPLPVLVDDILVNFDPGRARRAAKALASLAAGQQVLAFTCHPWLAELFEAEGARSVDFGQLQLPRVRAKAS